MFPLKIPACIFFWLLIAQQGFSQEQLGMRLSNYSGIHGTMFNPAFNVSAPVSWDINIIATGVFAENNYIFIKDAGILKILRNDSGFTFANQGNGESSNASEGLQYDFTIGNLRKEAYIHTFFTGPSAMFHIRNHTFGIFFNARAIVSANRIPGEFGYYDLDALETGDTLFAKPLKMAGMGWSEAGVNYGNRLLKNGKHTLDGGITLKFLQGYEGFYFQNHQPTNIRINVDSMTYESANVTYALSSGVTGYGDAAAPYQFVPRGFGASVDIGAVYYKDSENEKRAYDWKLGFSLLDFGKIFFSKNAQRHEIVTDQTWDFVQGEYEGVEAFSEVFRVLSEQSLNDPDASLAGNRFSIWMPAGVTFFAERSITNFLFINAAAVRRLRFRGAVTERGNIWAVTPRFEHKWFDVSLPLVLFNDTNIRLGLAMRFGPLVIGSDNMTSWFIPSDFTGSDIYFALKFNFFREENDDKQRFRPQKSRLGKDFGCYEF